MLKKSLFLVLAATLVAGLMFTGCPQEVIEYVDREVPVYVDRPIEPGQPSEPGPDNPVGPDTPPVVTPDPDPVPGPEQPPEPEVVYVVADVTVANSNALRTALGSSAHIIALTGNINGINALDADLVIPAGKILWLHGALEARPGRTIDVQGKVIVAYGGSLSAAKNNPVTVTGEGSIEVQSNGALVIDEALSVNNGATIPATVLGTKVKIDSPSATLEYTDIPLNLGLVKTAYEAYLAKGTLKVQGFKLSELVTVDPDADAAGTKWLVAKARENEDATVLTIPANMTLDAAVGDTLPEIVDLTVKGTLRIDANLALGKLKNLTVAKGRLETTSNFPAIEKIDLNGTLIGSTTTYWDTVTSLTVKGGTWQLPDAVFTKLTSLTIEEGTVLNAGKATFAGLVNLSIAQNAGLVAPKGTFEKVTNKDFAPSGTLVVNGTLTVGDNTATELFKALKKLEVNGSLTATTDTIAGTETVFPVLTDLTVNGYVSTNAPDAFKALVNLTVNNGATFVANGALTTLSKVGTLTVNNRQFSATAATWAGVKSLRVDGELSAPAGTFAATTSVTVNGKLTANTAIWDKVTSLTVNGEFSATAGTFAGVTALDLNGKLTGGPASTFVKLTTAANIKGTGELVATGQVPIGTAAKPGTAKLLFDSTLSSLTLGSTYDVAVKPLLGDLVVKEGTSRTFTVKDASAITGSITVDKGGTLIFADDDVAPVPGLNKAITVSGTLKFNGDNVVPGAITVKSGGTLEFNGNAAAPAGIITVDGGGKLAFNGIDPVPAGDIAVNGEMLVKDGTTVTIAAGKELKVNGTLTATDLELKGVTYKVPAGGSLVIKALLSGSTMTATVLAGALDGTFAIAPGGYIQDTTPKQSWTLQGGSRGGSLVYTGSTTKAIILGDGSITTTETGAKMKTAGYVLLTGTASLVVHDYVGSGETIGLNLSKVVIDLTPVQPSDSASIIVEPYGKLNLAASTGAGTLTVAGCIVTDNAQLKGASAPVKGVAARQPVSGDLLGTPGAAVLTGGKLNVPGLIGGGNSTVTIDAYDAFVNDDPDSGQITVVRLFE